MELTLEAQTQAFIYSCVLGVILAVIYTAIGIIKIISPPSKKLLFVMDIPVSYTHLTLPTTSRV